MSAYRFVTLTCDDCGEIWDEESTTSIRVARKAARRAGWKFDRTRGDTCPLHNGYERGPSGFGYYRIGDAQ